MAGKKTFVAGEVLLAQDVNDYLMDQTVMTFASSAARSSAIPTPTEGMMSVVTNTDDLEYYNGSAWVNASRMGAWIAYTPTWAGITNKGSGAFEAYYYNQVGKTVTVNGRLTLGTSPTITGGVGFSVSLPVTGRGATAGGFVQGTVCIEDAGVNLYQGTVSTSTAVANFLIFGAATTYTNLIGVNSTVPMTWIMNDSIYFQFTYEAA